MWETKYIRSNQNISMQRHKFLDGKISAANGLNKTC